MRRISGLFDGVEHVILEYEHGTSAWPSDLAQVLARQGHSLPTGDELLAQCRVRCGESLEIQEY